MFNKRTDISRKEVGRLESSPIFEKIKDIDLSKINMKDYEKPYKNKEVNITTIDRIKIKVETGWSNEIVDSIDSMEEYKIYKGANLVEGEINSKPCLMKVDIDMNQKDGFGMTNAERMKEGLTLIDKNGERLNLHHIGQRADSPLAELTFTEHMRNGNDTILHDKTKPSEINRAEFNIEKQNYWKSRYENSLS